jgi:hypothetical protein
MPTCFPVRGLKRYLAVRLPQIFVASQHSWKDLDLRRHFERMFSRAGELEKFIAVRVTFLSFPRSVKGGDIRRLKPVLRDF